MQLWTSKNEDILVGQRWTGVWKKRVNDVEDEGDMAENGSSAPSCQCKGKQRQNGSSLYSEEIKEQFLRLWEHSWGFILTFKTFLLVYAYLLFGCIELKLSVDH